MQSTTKKPRIVSKPEVLDRVGVTYPTIWTWMREGKFPRSRELGGKSSLNLKSKRGSTVALSAG
jgi:predicted DNA-binding transcriptional regulator AlpA